MHMDNPWRLSRKEIIVFEVMKVLPEVKEMHWILRGLCLDLRKTQADAARAERQVHVPLPQPSHPLTPLSPPPCAL